MSTTILQAPVGAGKTEAVLDRLQQVLDQDSPVLPRAWVLLATRRQEVAFRQRLIERVQAHAAYFNIEFFDFYEFNARLLNLAGRPARRINETARQGILRDVCADLQQAGALQVFGRIARLPGFVRVLGDFIYELKQGLVYPEHYEAAARSQKDRELALIYRRYQETLQQGNLVDREGEGWLALAEIQQRPELGRDVNLLVVDGFDQFTPVQAALLAQLSLRIADCLVTLTTAPDREHLIGRRFQRALEEIERAHADIGAAVRRQVIDQEVLLRPPQLQRLTQDIARYDVGPHPVDPQDDHLKLIEAPEPEQEAAAVLREVKSLLHAGVRPDDILIALRDWERYYRVFQTYGELYGLPLLCHYSEPISQNLAVAMLFEVLELYDADEMRAFPRERLLDVLRSPYIQAEGIGPEQVRQLEHISRVRIVMAGRRNWLEALKIDEQAEQVDGRIYDEDGNPMEPLLPPQQAGALGLALADFFDCVTPLPRATVQQHIQWLENLIGEDPLQEPEEDPDDIYPDQFQSLRLIAAIRAGEAGTDYAVVNRDIAAVNSLKSILSGLLAAEHLRQVVRGIGPREVTWRQFYRDLLDAVRSASAPQRDPIRSGRVLVTTTANARGLPHQYVFIPGLAEGIFPQPAPEDPLYLDSDRVELTARGVPLPTSSERVDDEGVFYELINLTQKRLTLSRPYVQDGKPWNESHLWRMVLRVFADLKPQRIGIGQVAAPQQAATLEEAALAVVASGQDDQLREVSARVSGWLMAAPDRRRYWERIQHGYATERDRLSRRPHNEYTGRLRRPELVAHVRQHLNRDYLWSATQLNDYGACGYRFFASRLLGLEALEAPEEGLDALQAGLINHQILEETYFTFKQDGLWIEPANRELALDVLNSTAHRVFQEAPARYGFRVSRLWDHERAMILHRLRRLVSQDFSEESPLNEFGERRRVWWTEMRFGSPFAYPDLRIPLGDNLNGAAETIAVRGAIDRIDIVDDRRLVVVDYKTGSTKISQEEMERGWNFQMVVYLLALREVLGVQGDALQIAGGLFWHIRSAEISGVLLFDEAVPVMEAAQSHAARYIARARQGDFAVQPSRIENGRCVRYCEFYQLCRLNNTFPHKAT